VTVASPVAPSAVRRAALSAVLDITNRPLAMKKVAGTAPQPGGPKNGLQKGLGRVIAILRAAAR
jgi:hypothetical protein